MSLSWKRLASMASLALGLLGVEAASAATSEVLVKAGTSGLAVDTLVVLPDAARNESLPILFMQHGFMLSQTYYRDLFSQIADQGFVVVAPQAYKAGGLPFGKPSAAVEAKTVASAIDWSIANLSDEIDQNIDFNRLGLVNHSRGSKVAWMMVRDNLVKAKAIAAIDPVDGSQDGTGRVTGSFSLPLPALIVGTGLGGNGGGIFSPACAPKSDNYESYYTATNNRTWLMVAEDYGHLDFIDSNTNCGMVCNVCSSGAKTNPTDDFRTFLAQTIGQFMTGVLHNQDGLLSDLEDQSLAPIRVSVRTK
ncbi:MAG: chlorophyllase/cutinase-like alpha/beta fold protein [Oligoflexus sp.]